MGFQHFFKTIRFAAEIFALQINMDVRILPCWIPREENETADALSKFRDTDDWGIDMESFGYTLINLMQGKLPWQGLKSKSKQEHMKKIYEMKRSFSIKKLCEKSPMEFRKIMLHYFLHVRNLGFKDTPDYDYLRKLFLPTSNVDDFNQKIPNLRMRHD